MTLLNLVDIVNGLVFVRNFSVEINMYDVLGKNMYKYVLRSNSVVVMSKYW